MQGTVVSVGANSALPLANRESPALKAGDRVCFRSAAGDEVTVDGQSLLILEAADILAVLDEIETGPTELESQAGAAEVSKSSRCTMLDRFLFGIGSVLEIFPSPDRFDSWRLTQDTPFGAWPATVRNEFADLQSELAKSEEPA